MGKGGKGGGSQQAAKDRSNSMNPNNARKHGSLGSRPAKERKSLPSGWTPTSGCELCENSGPHKGPCGYFQEGEFYPFPGQDGVPDDG
jgi:hypothetical protein